MTGIKVRRQAGRTFVDRVELTPQQRATAWRTECPTCSAPIVPMSEIAPHLPSATPPNRGDAIRCSACGHYCLVERVEETPDHGRRVIVCKVQVPDA